MVVSTLTSLTGEGGDDGLSELRRHLKRKRNGEQKRNSITCFVVNEHNEALVCIHKAIRRKDLSFHNNLLVHIDSHPDLMIPSNLENADDIYKPHMLYNLLRASESGIAEFILPLVYADHVNRVAWIRPPWSTQIRGE